MAIGQEDIDDLLLAPKKTKTDEGEIEERSVKELTQAIDKSKANAVGDTPLHGLRVSKFKPGGAL